MSIDSEMLTILGEVKYFTQTADSDYETQNGFCPTCGSPVLGLSGRFPEARYIHAATLDDPSIFAAEMVVFSECAQPWDTILLDD